MNAEEECRIISRLYPRSTLLTGTVATKDRFLDLAPRYDVLHIAAHAVANPLNPGLSYFVFAPERDSEPSTFLYAREVASLNLEGPRLAILAACDTALGSVSDTEGAIGLGRAFLQAGIPSVVATLWPISDTASAELLPQVHLQMRAGLAPARALRLAQLHLLRSPVASFRSPSVWAAFQLSQTLSDPKGGRHA